jgi:hypothetical protein
MDGVERDQEEDQALEVPEAAAVDEDLEDDSPLAAEVGGGGWNIRKFRER